MFVEQLIDKRRRISVIMVSARADVGGGPIHILRLLSGFKALANFELAVAIPKHQELSNKLTQESDFAIDMPVRSFSFRALRGLVRYIKENDVDIVHSHGFGAGVYARIAKFFVRSKIVHTYHGLKIPSSPKDWVKFALEWFLSYNTDLAICVSASERDVTSRLRLNPRSQIVIYHAISEFFFTERSLAKKDVESILIGTLSRLDDGHKNIGMLISTLALLPKFYELQIAGTGPDSKKLMAQVRSLGLTKRCHFVGHVASSAEFLKSLDIFVSASHHEGMPAAVLEAVALNIKCVLSDIPPHREIGSDLNVPLFKPNDLNSLARILERPEFIRYPRESNEYSNFHEKFSLARMVSQTADVYSRLVGIC